MPETQKQPKKPVTPFQKGLWTGIVIGGLGGMLLGAGCAATDHPSNAPASASSSDNTTGSTNTASNADASARNQGANDPSPPAHGWISKDGQEYAYSSALSEDDQKAGKASSDVLMFRYLGEKNGLYTVASKQSGVLTTASCADPCQIVKIVMHTPFGPTEQHITFNPDSVVGTALTDAFNGQMEIYHRAKTMDAEGE